LLIENQNRRPFLFFNQQSKIINQQLPF